MISIPLRDWLKIFSPSGDIQTVADVDGKRIGGSGQDLAAAQLFFQEAEEDITGELVVYDFSELAAEAASSGEVDGCIIPLYWSVLYSDRYGLKESEVTIPGDTKSAVAFAEGSNLVDEMNRFLELYSTEEIWNWSEEVYQVTEKS